MNPIKPNFKTELLPIIFILAAVIFSFYFYAHFPQQVPIHWNAAGQVDNYGSRAFAAFFFPAIIIGMYLLFLAIPYIDPRKARYDQFRRVYHIFKDILVALMVAIYFITGLSGIGYNVPVSFWVPGLIGVMFIVLGNYMSKIKPNWFMGIRTPWTLSSEEVWNKTHRLGGKLFILAGAVMIFMYLFPVSWRLPVLITMVVILSLGTMAYSYVLYAREEKKRNINSHESGMNHHK